MRKRSTARRTAAKTEKKATTRRLLSSNGPSKRNASGTRAPKKAASKSIAKSATTHPIVPHAAAKPSSKARDLEKPIRLQLLSDSTGNLANHMLSAFLTQFPRDAMVVSLRNFLTTPAKLDAALHEVAREGGVVFHAFVKSMFKDAIQTFCAARGLPACDLTGDFIRFIADATGIRPSEKVDALHEVSGHYRDRIEALEFTLAHDDGLGLDTIDRAEIVLAGISRTSKTPTSILLGQQGFRVANVALAIEVNPPAELLAVPPDRVIGLLIDPTRLQDVRQSRRHDWKMESNAYTDFDHIQQEVRWSRKLFNAQGWRTLDVTNSAIEETAARILAMRGFAPRDAEHPKR